MAEIAASKPACSCVSKVEIYNVAEIYNAEETAATEPAFHCGGKMNVAENQREKNIGVKIYL